MHRVVRAGLLALLTLSLASCAPLFDLLCGEIRHPYAIDPSPLLEVDLPQDAAGLSELLRSSAFIEVDASSCTDCPGYDLIYGEMPTWDEGDVPGTPRVYVFISGHPGPIEATRVFLQMCEGSGFDHPELFVTGGSTHNSYCASYLAQYRMPIDSFCTKMDQYHGTVIFQKGRWVIQLNESTRDPETEAMNAVIRLLSNSTLAH